MAEISLWKARELARREIISQTAEQLMRDKGIKPGLCEKLCPDCTPDCPLIKGKVKSFVQAILSVSEGDRRIEDRAQQIHRNSTRSGYESPSTIV